MPDGPGSVNEPESVPRQTIEFTRIALVSGILQRFDSSAAKLGGLLFFRPRLELGHGTQARDCRRLAGRPQRSELERFAALTADCLIL
jgi:hypothetical protein